MGAIPGRGFTLIEMLVVMLIMGLLVSVTVLSTGLFSRADSAASDSALAVAENLSRLFQHASQQALAKNEVLGWSVVETQDRQSMRWWRWSSAAGLQPGMQPAPTWVPLDDNLMAAIDMPDNVQLHAGTDTRSASVVPPSSNARPINSPSVVFFPGREYSIFEIVVRDADSGQSLARVWPERDGQINWSAM
ncbi:MAG: GspH/FimT family pseudopilin [Pseudohongiella sp.]|nr:GspH/FimT family pseudopilin [Pseudohongiella sp.]